MRGLFIAIVIIGAAGGAYMLSNLIPASGVLVDLQPKLVDRCMRVDIALGTEDVAIDPDLNAAFVSAADRRAWFNEVASGGEALPPAAPTNGVYLMDLAAPYGVRRVSPEGMDDFLPHGISLWRGDNGEKRLFVVNHAASGAEIVEIFDIGEDGALTHIDSVSFDAMHSPNDVVAIGPRQFYATNDRGYEEGLMSLIEAYMALPFSNLVFYDGEAGRVAADGLAYANGVNRSADGETIYVAEFLKRRIAVFDRDTQTNDLTLVRTIATDTGPDNIDVAEDGALWIGGHTKVFEFLAHAEDETAIAPSHVVRVDPDTGENEDVFIDIGGVINGSSVGAVSGDTLIVGAVFDGHVMVCPLGADG